MAEPGAEPTTEGTACDGAAGPGHARIAGELRRLARVYDDERVLSISVRTSRRLTASLGRAHLSRGEVVLTEALLESRHLEEVVTHEIAHVVAFWRHGRIRPHGAAWKELVRVAGHTPIVSMAPLDFRLPPRRRRRRRARRPVTLTGFLRSLL